MYPPINPESDTHEFELGGTGSNVSLLVWGSGRARSVSVVGTVSLWLGTSHTSSGRADTGSLRALCALVRGRHDLGRQVQVGSQVFRALVCEVPERERESGMRSRSLWTQPVHSPVEVAPGKLFLHEAAGLQGLHGLDDVQVGDGLQLGVLGRVEVLLGHHDSLLEEVLIDGDTMLLGHKHPVEGIHAIRGI